MTAPALYREALLRNSLTLLLLGYGKLAVEALSDLEETTITGHLVDSMNAVLNSADPPPWGMYLTVVDDEIRSVDNKTGKRRPRVDICVRCLHPRPEARMAFEAKRLRSSSCVAGYLGEDGMMALVGGYYGNLASAGMVGYVQSETCEHWSTELRKAMTASPNAFALDKPVEFHSVDGFDDLFRTQHNAKTIVHMLLQCV